MRGVPNYEEKMNKIKAKIEKKMDELKKLRSELNSLEERADSKMMLEIAKVMNERKISPKQVLDLINEKYPVNPTESSQAPQVW